MTKCYFDANQGELLTGLSSFWLTRVSWDIAAFVLILRRQFPVSLADRVPTDLESHGRLGSWKGQECQGKVLEFYLRPGKADLSVS